MQDARLAADIRLNRPENDRVGVCFEEVTRFLQETGVFRDLLDVIVVVGEMVREIDVATGEDAEGAEEGPVLILRSDRDVSVLAHGDFRQPVGGGVHRLPADITNQGVAIGVPRDLRIVRRAEPEAGRRLNSIAPLVAGDEERPDKRHPVGGVGQRRISETKLGGIHIPDVRGSRELVSPVIRFLVPRLVSTQQDHVGLRLECDFQTRSGLLCLL